MECGMGFSHISHGQIIEIIYRLGFRKNKTGVCAGLTALWIYYALRDKEEQFTQLLNLICEKGYLNEAIKLKNKIALLASEMERKKQNIRVPVNLTRKKIAELKPLNTPRELRKLKLDLRIQMREREAQEVDLEEKENYLTIEERKILETFSFLQWIELSASASKHQLFLNQSLEQSHLQETFNNMLAEMTFKIEQVYLDSIIYTEDELTDYFNKLAYTLTCLEEKILPMAIDGKKHRIGLRYDIKKQLWILSDPNQLPPIELKKDEIARRVMRALSDDRPNSSGQIFTSFNIWMFSDKNSQSLAATKEAMNTFKDNSIHAITKEMAERQSAQFGSLLDATAYAGDAKVTQRIAEYKVSLDQRRKSQSGAPAHMAAQYGHAAVMKVLRENEANLEVDLLTGSPAIMASEKGRLAVLKELAEAKIDFNKPGKFGEFAIHAAAAHGQVDVIKFFAEQKNPSVDFNILKYGRSPIFTAVEYGHFEVVKVLLEHGVKVTSDDITKLANMAAKKGHVSIMEFLIEHGLDLNKTFLGNTLAHVAAENGHHVIIKLLNKHNVNLNKETWIKKTPLIMAVENGHTNVVKALLESKSIDLNAHPETLATIAVKQGHISVLKVLVDYDAKILNQANKLGDTPISLAMKNSNTCSLIFVPYLYFDKFQLAEAKPAYVITDERMYYIDKSNNQHIEIPINEENLKQLKIVLDIEDIALQEKEKLRVVFSQLSSIQLTHIASFANHSLATEMVKILVKMNADVNLPDIKGETPLFHAVKQNDIEMIKRLMEHGAKLTSADIAAAKDKSNIVKQLPFLAALYGDVNAVQALVEPIFAQRLAFIAAEQGHAQVIQLLAEKNLIDVNQPEMDDMHKNKNTLACIAAEKGHVSVIKILKKFKANLNKPNAFQRPSTLHSGMFTEYHTPAELAAKNGHVEVLKELIASGLKVTDRKLYTKESIAFELASEAVTAGQLSVVQLMVAEDKSILEQVGLLNETLVFSALVENKIEILKFLSGFGSELLNKPARRGVTPALYAAKYNYQERLTLLATLGANLYIEDESKNSAALMAVEKGWTDILQILVNNAAKKGDTEKMLWLVQHKVDLNDAAMIAVKQGQIGVLEILLEQKAVDFNMKDYLGRTVAFIAAQNGRSDIIDILGKCSLIDFNQPDKYGRTPAFIAAEMGHVEVLQLLAKWGADLNKPDEIGLTPALIAKHKGQSKVIKFFEKLTKQKSHSQDSSHIDNLVILFQPVKEREVAKISDKRSEQLMPLSLKKQD